jgi:UDP:flavonoid glycosyltransferase YjiC (YdhE family)
MANVLIAWELGAGLAHLMQLLPFAERLVPAGHRVFAAVRNVEAAGALLGRAGAHLLQCPTCSVPDGQATPAVSFANVMGKTGFGADAQLAALAAAWRVVYRLTRPDVIVFDHAPVALLASRGLPCKRVVIGPGFFCPPDRAPMPPMGGRVPKGVDPAALHARLRADEAAILARCNRLLDYWKAPRLGRLAQLYADADETLLTTFRELDHYGDRGGDDARYDGPVIGTGGEVPQWPAAGRGPRVYAYLKPSPALPHVLAALRDRGCPTLVSPDGIPRAARAQFECDTLRFETRRLDLKQVGAACDLAVLNGNHGTTCAMLLAGKPVLQMPRTLEQAITARAVARLGAGAVVGGKADAGTVRDALDGMLANDAHARAAAAFAARYADFDPAKQRAAMVAKVERLLPGA